jgi:D-glycero-D-manno-heptose 1,7-bisphosphate phosphatase
VKRPAVFLDRDGTVNEQMGYINHLSRFHLLAGAARAVRLLNEQRYLVIVVSNQSGVARGYFPLGLVHEVHARMAELLGADGASVDRVYFCPHHPEGSVAEFRTRCDCRKPRTGLMEQARKDFEIDMGRSWVIGDRYSDIEFADRAGLPGILVKTGYGRGELDHVIPNRPLRPVRAAEDLLDAVTWILKGGTD